ncbi:MAG: enoyl-CoA hydratase-related protein [Actinomycetota bacterium]|nr:enoyl-CoA hydratase-related protein [Actinomycetota bacterium]
MADTPADRDPSTAEHDLLVTREGGVVTITLNRPKRKNALTAGMVTGIIEAVRAASDDDDARVIVITANGDDFCSGMDLVQSNDTSGVVSKPRIGHLQRRMQVGAHDMILELDAVQLPVVAAVRGWAAGVGNMLALSADVVVATPSTKFWVPFVTKGFSPDSGNTWLLPRLVGLARAKEMVLRGEPIDGIKAAEWGLISRCVPDADLDAAVAEVVGGFAKAATISVGLAKTLLHNNLSADLRTALHNEAIHEELALRSDDFKEGMRSFAQRRPPEYTGR